MTARKMGQWQFVKCVGPTARIGLAERENVVTVPRRDIMKSLGHHGDMPSLVAKEGLI